MSDPIAVLDKCDRGDASAPGGHVRPWGGTCEIAKVAVQMRLIAVAALKRDVRPPPRLGVQQPQNAFEAKQPSDRLRRLADLLAKAGGEMTPAAAQLRGQRRHRQLT